MQFAKLIENRADLKILFRRRDLENETIQPNKAIEPTPMLGTSAAAQPSLPSTGAAHL